MRVFRAAEGDVPQPYFFRKGSMGVLADRCATASLQEVEIRAGISSHHMLMVQHGVA